MTMSDSPNIPEARLIGMKGLLSDLEFKILADTIYIGRVPGNDVVLNDTSVSSQHAKITWENNNFIISDLDSKNGISVNGKAVTKRVLRNGDKLKVGGTTFRFVFKASSTDQQGSPGEGGTNPVRLAIYAIAAFIILIIVAKLLPTQQPLPSADEKREEVQIYLTMDNINQQMKSIAIPSSEDPHKTAEYHYRSGVINFDAGQFRKAMSEFIIASRMNPTEPKYEAALKNGLEHLNKEIDYHVRLGKVHYDNLRYQAAIKEWEYALFLIEDSSLAQYDKIRNDISVIKKRLESRNTEY